MHFLLSKKVIHIEKVFTCLCFSCKEAVLVCVKLPSISHFIHKCPDLTFSRTLTEVEVQIVNSLVKLYVFSMKLKSQRGHRKKIKTIHIYLCSYNWPSSLRSLWWHLSKQSILTKREIVKNWETLRARYISIWNLKARAQEFLPASLRLWDVLPFQLRTTTELAPSYVLGFNTLLFQRPLAWYTDFMFDFYCGF